MEAIKKIVDKIIEEAEKAKKLTGGLSQECRTICNICDDTGFITTEGGLGSINKEELVKRCKCRLDKILALKLGKVPALFQKKPLAYLEDTDVRQSYNKNDGTELCRNFPRDFMPSKNYFMCGKTGAGKSTFLWAQYMEFINSGIFNVYAESCIDLLAKYQEQKYAGIQHFDFYRPDGCHLFIDDIDKVNMSDDRSMQMYDIIDTAYRNKLGITITSNRTLHELEEDMSLGKETYFITRRIRDMCTLVYF